MVERQIGRLEGLFWLVIGIIICVLGWKFGLGSLQEPGSGFVAFIMGLFLSGLGLLMILWRIYSRAHRGVVRLSAQIFRGAPVFLIVCTVGGIVGYGLLLETLGYCVTTLLLMWALFYLFYAGGEHRPFLSFFAALLTVSGSYLVFEVWLRSQLPRGLFPWW